VNFLCQRLLKVSATQTDTQRDKQTDRQKDRCDQTYYHQNTNTKHLFQYVTIHPCQLSLAIPSWVGAMSTSQRAVLPCGWGVKAGNGFCVGCR